MLGRRACVLLTLLLISTSPTAAHGSVPSPANSIVPTHFSLVGTSNDIADPAGGFTVFLRDLANIPIEGALVVVDLSQCPDVRLCADPHDGCVPGSLATMGGGGGPPPFDSCQTVDCATRTVRKFSSAAGTASFRIVGSSIGPMSGSGSPAHCARVYEDGVLIGSPSVSLYDLNGGGVGPSDLSVWLTDFFGPYNPPRSDYNGSGLVDPADLSSWLILFFGAGSAVGCTNLCP